MYIRHIDFSLYNQKLIHLLDSSSISNGLASGKMGYCIYFYRLSRLLNNRHYESVAEKILCDLLPNIKNLNALDLSNGLSGIGLGIDYLIKEKYVQGDINHILRNVDDFIFAGLSYPQKQQRITLLDITYLLVYLNVRLKDQKKGSEQEYLFKELIIQTINSFYERIGLAFFEEPDTFTIDYPLPLFLYVLSLAYKHDFYNNRIEKIIGELSPKLLSILPTLHANRLFFIWGMNSIQKVINRKDWDDHILFLANTLNMELIVTDELRDKSIFLKDGLTGIYLIAEGMENNFSYPKKISEFKKKILSKISRSQVWEMMNTETYFSKKAGLLDGYCGVSLLLQTISHT